MSVNKVILVGRLGQDPELKHTNNGNSVCNLSVATSKKWTDKKDQKQEKTEWHRIVCWQRLAERCAEYLKKGRQVYIEGELETRSWEDDQGNKRYTTEIVANNVQFLGGQNENNPVINKSVDSRAVMPDQVETSPEFTSTEIPF